MTEKKFEFINHTADIGIRVYGKTLEELFINSAFGMYNVICEKFKKILPKQKYKNTITSFDNESLIISSLNDLLYQTFVNKILFCNFEVKNFQSDHLITFVCYGEEYNKNKHGHLIELKSVTFHNIKIKKNSYGLFETTIIFDT
ncbi:MAG: archease [Candidatus Omnitrophica bacterium]|nr:archease [Candidatus Omnitrophota bacterium]